MTPRIYPQIREELMQRTSTTSITIKELAEMGLAVALGIALNYLSKAIWSMPMGGTLELGIVPVLYVALKWGCVMG